MKDKVKRRSRISVCELIHDPQQCFRHQCVAFISLKTQLMFHSTKHIFL